MWRRANQKYVRLAYGEEIEWGGEDWPAIASANPCHDCGARKGQLHVPNCDMEQCPRCKGQMLSCPCEVTEKFEEDEDDPSTALDVLAEPLTPRTTPAIPDETTKLPPD
jgi:hypothetical protein